MFVGCDHIEEPLPEIEYDFENQELIAAIGDGVGGGECGDIASGIFIKNLKKYFSFLRTNYRDVDMLFSGIAIVSHKEILKYAEEHRLDFIGTTAIIALFKGNVLHLGWAGDSRAYLFRNDKLEMLSRDHSPLWDRLKKGEISENEAWEMRHSATLNRCLGDDLLSPIPDYKRFDIKRGDIFLLCSDGLTSEMKDDMIEKILKSGLNLRDTANDLLEAAIESGSKDDISIFILQVL